MSTPAHAAALKRLRSCCRKRGFGVSLKRYVAGYSLVILGNFNGLIYAGIEADAEQLVDAARAWLDRDHPRSPGAPKGNRNGAGWAAKVKARRAAELAELRREA
jgi:hypothetical protein